MEVQPPVSNELGVPGCIRRQPDINREGGENKIQSFYRGRRKSANLTGDFVPVSLTLGKSRFQ
jgi:hypothetical protein